MHKNTNKIVKTLRSFIKFSPIRDSSEKDTVYYSARSRSSAPIQTEFDTSSYAYKQIKRHYNVHRRHLRIMKKYEDRRREKEHELKSEEAFNDEMARSENRQRKSNERFAQSMNIKLAQKIAGNKYFIRTGVLGHSYRPKDVGYSPEDVGYRTSGSSVDTVDKYVSRRDTATDKEQSKMPGVNKDAYIPPYSDKHYANSLFGVPMVFKYTIGTKNILLCGDSHEYQPCYPGSIYLLDWVRAMCIVHEDKKLMLLIEHPPNKSVCSPLYHTAALFFPGQGHMFGPSFKLRNKLKTIKNLDIVGVDLRVQESGGRKVKKNLDILEEELNIYGMPKYTLVDMIVNPTNYENLSSYDFITQFSKIINNALSGSIFSDSKVQFFTSLLYVYSDLEDEDIDVILMDTYCLALMFSNHENNIIVNAGGAHVQTYANFINHYFETIETFHKHSYSEEVYRCVRFDKPYDFLENNGNI